MNGKAIMFTLIRTCYQWADAHPGSHPSKIVINKKYEKDLVSELNSFSFKEGFGKLTFFGVPVEFAPLDGVMFKFYKPNEK